MGFARPYFQIHDPMRRPEAGHEALQSVSYLPTDLPALLKMTALQTATRYAVYIVELGGGYILTMLQAYATKHGLTLPPIRDLSVGGAANSPDGDPNGPDTEVMLDIVTAAGVGGAAIKEIVMVWCPNTEAGFLGGIEAAIGDAGGGPAVGSISWGGPEDTFQDPQAYEAAFAGSPFPWFVAAGDNGSRDGTGQQVVDLPSACPSAGACGGVYLLGDPETGAVELLTVWNDGRRGGATGGGVSKVFAAPGRQADCTAIEHKGVTVHPLTGRGVPDVAGVAAPESGIVVPFTNGQEGVVGGTSAVAPAMAGRCAREGWPGQMLDDWYADSPFIDVVPVQGHRPGNGFYLTAPGWDACTGLGV